MQTLVEALVHASELDALGLTFLGPKLESRDLTWAQVADLARRKAGHLMECGVQRGERLALMLPDNEDFVLSFFAALWLGAVPVPLYPPSPLGRAQSQLLRTKRILEAARADWVLAPASLAEPAGTLADGCADVRGVVETDDGTASSAQVAPAAVNPEDLCFVQFTSGSTADPKGVMISHRNAVANVLASHQALGSDSKQDIGVNWVPLYHDMGLIGSVITPLLSAGRHIYIPTLSFAARPQVWLELVHRYRGTMISSNNYGLRAATKRLPRVDGLDLSCLRVISVGAEPIQLETVQHFIETFEPHGLDPRALNPAYGMAEATLAISCKDPRQHVRSVSLDRAAYEAEQRALPLDDSDSATEGLTVVSCGKALPGHRLAIVDSSGQALPQGCVGEILFAGPSVTSGYFNNPEATEALFAGEWMKTGDLGFMLDGELHVSGRCKDLIIIAGRNYHPQMIEWALADVPGLRAHHSVALSVQGPDTEALVVLAECQNPHKLEGLTQAVRSKLNAELGLDPTDILILAPWSLPKTSSGKPQRRQALAGYRDGTLKVVSRSGRTTT